jgi:hypothetical protein
MSLRKKYNDQNQVPRSKLDLLDHTSSERSLYPDGPDIKAELSLWPNSCARSSLWSLVCTLGRRHFRKGNQTGIRHDSQTLLHTAIP